MSVRKLIRIGIVPKTMAQNGTMNLEQKCMKLNNMIVQQNDITGNLNTAAAPSEQIRVSRSFWPPLHKKVPTFLLRSKSYRSINLIITSICLLGL